MDDEPKNQAARLSSPLRLFVFSLVTLVVAAVVLAYAVATLDRSTTVTPCFANRGMITVRTCSGNTCWKVHTIRETSS